MPWSPTMSSKDRFITDVIGRGLSVSEAAAISGISRSCAYKWFARYQELGLNGLEERSRAPHTHPNQTANEVVAELLKLKAKHPSFGPQKLAVMLESEAGKHVIAASTAGEVLSRHGLVKRRKKSPRSPGAISHPPFDVGASGESMTTDFKGDFRTRDRCVCRPLTVADPVSRFLFEVKALSSTRTAPVQAAFERIFREYGLPRLMISDNGSPYCSSKSLGGLTALSRWWIELGIRPVRIVPGRPQQNGIHERMHRSLSEWLKFNLREDLRRQQFAFNRFRREFNEIRPHEALGMKTPISALGTYKPYPRKKPRVEYDSTMTVRAVRSNGYIKWNGIQIFVSEVLTGANIGLRKIDTHLWTISYGHVQIGFLDELQQRVLNSLSDESKSKSSAREEAEDENP